MKTKIFLRSVALASIVAVSTVAQAQVTVGTFTGSAAGQGLDLQGNFNYALTFNPDAAGTTLGDATFTNAFTTSRITVENQNYIQNWYPGTYTDSANDIALGQVMQSIVWSSSNGNADSQVVTLSMSGLTVGQTYKTQLLFAEACCNRGFNVYQDGTKISSELSPYMLTGNNSFNDTESVVLTDTFMAMSSSVIFGFGGTSSLHADNNPILNAATLENVSAVPEPESYSMLLAGLGLMGFMKRRKSAKKAA